MSYIDVTGKTEDEAIRKALEQLGMDRDDVSVEILERAKSGFLGIGGTPARVRVTYGPEESEVIPEPVKPARKEPEKQEPARKEGTRPPQRQEKKPERKPEKQEKKQEKKPERQEKQTAAPVPVQPEEELPLCEDSNAKRIEAFLTGLLAQLESQAQIKVYEVEKGRYKVILEGEKLGQLIGRRGETLDAVQQLTNYAVNSGSEKRIRVQVDAENYRRKREQSLESLAGKVADKVKRYHRSVTLEPMNAYERHVIHSALQDVADVTTYSIGTEPNRRIVVSYDREKK
ncbi:MAG: protein jag [Ruminococcaceae bacterium]|jgi:spoIIIJ-associated protein|nr:protein jag [Oscillospiraceae bacterium]